MSRLFVPALVAALATAGLAAPESDRPTASTAHAPAPADTSRLTESVEVHRVRFPIVAKPKGGAPDSVCAALALDDVEVREGDGSGRVTAVERADEGTLYAIVVDISPSMTERLDGIKTALHSFARALAAREEVMLLTFDNELMVRRLPTRDPALLDAAIDALEPGGLSTAVHDAVYDVLDFLEQRAERRAIVLITDGEDTSSTRHSARDTVARAAACRDLRIFALVTAGVDRLPATAPLRWLVMTTAGRFELVPDDRALAGGLDAIRERLAREMIVTYAPPAPAHGKETPPERVRVKVRERKGVRCSVKEAMPERVVSYASIE